MLEITTIYPRYHKCSSLANFNILEAKCSALLGLPDDESTLNYANPIKDINGKIWLVVNTELSSLFTELEINAMVQFDEIILPTEKI
jgi:hypothetical protein